MKNLFFSALIVLGSLQTVFGQTPPNLGTNPATFILFTSAGALKNNGASRVTGNIGTQVGDYEGFTASGVLTGVAHIADDVSLAASQEMPAVYNSFPAGCDFPLVTPLGGIVPLVPGIYCTVGAANIDGNIILDANFNSSAVFIIKVNGALSTSASSRVILTNGASLANVYWQVQDAFTLGQGSTFRGTVIAGGAIELLEGSSLVGRALTTAGAITLHNNRVAAFEDPLPVTLTSFNLQNTDAGAVMLSWTTTLEMNSERFEVQHSVEGKQWDNIGTVQSANNSVNTTHYEFTHQTPAKGSNLYRLKMVDRDQTFAYSKIRSINMTGGTTMIMFPNPVISTVNILDGDMSKVIRIQINNLSGQMVYDRSKSPGSNLPQDIDMTALPSGIYTARITSLLGIVSVHKIIKL